MCASDFLFIDVEGEYLQILKESNQKQQKIKAIGGRHNLRKGPNLAISHAKKFGLDVVFEECSMNDYSFVLRD